MTIYHLVGLSKLESAIRDDKGELSVLRFEIEGGRPALCLQIQTQRKTPAWGGAFESITGQQLNVFNYTAGAVVVIQHEVKETVSAWAISFGQGFHYIDQYYLDQRYGIRFAARVADPESLVSLSKVSLDDRPKIERSSIPSGDSLRGLGFNETGDFATRVVGKVNLSLFELGDKTVKLQSSDAISLPMPLSAHDLMSSLDTIAAILNEPENSSLKALEQLANVPPGAVRSSLYEMLSDAINCPEEYRLTVTWPHEMSEEFGRAEAFKIGRDEKEGLPSIGDLTAKLIGKNAGDLQKALSRNGVVLLDGLNGSPVSPKIPLARWLSFERDMENRRYFFQGGKWYTMKDSYSTQIASQVDSIFCRSLPMGDIPNWDPGLSEHEFNEMLACHFGGVCLDGRLVKGEFYRDPIEPCDVLLPDGVFIHVKNASASAPVSHLLSQAFVATDAARVDPSFRRGIEKRIEEAGQDPSRYSSIPTKVVIVMAKKRKALRPSSLFTFSQINLVRFVNDVESGGRTRIYVAPILKEI